MPDIKDPQRKQRQEQKKLFGEDFPAIGGDAEEWKKWIESRMKEQEGPMRDKRLHWSRHRHFWQGRQWISTRDNRTWREVNDDEVRQTMNLIGPALDYRVGLVAEQKPGFRCQPLGTGIEGQETAEAQQRIAEYYYNKLLGAKLLRDSTANALPDGVSFLHVFVDKSMGPKREDVRLVPKEDPRYANLIAMGYEEKDGNVILPLNEEGDVAGVGTAVRVFNEGDIGTRVLLAHEVIFDPEAKTVNGPYDRARWAIIRRIRDLKSARLEAGDDSITADQQASAATDPILDSGDAGGFPNPTGFQRGLPPFPTSRMRQREESVFDYLIYIAPNEAAGFPLGLYRRVIGNKVVEESDELPGGKIPLARLTDGSADPEMFPRPVMATWLPDQISINAIVTVLLQHIRVFGLGRAIAQKGTILSETYTTIAGAVLEYTGQAPTFQQGVSASGDVWKSLEFFVKKLEDKDGWNDLARGAISQSGSMQDVSGRALLGAKEMFERTFGPLIRSTAEGMSEWARLVVDYARWLFNAPRLIPVTGRGDLAKKISAEDLGEESLVYVDPTTLSPLPYAVRQQILYDMMTQGLISKDVYMKNTPFGELRDIYYGGQEQWQRAQWVNMMLEQRWEELVALSIDTISHLSPERGVPIWWQDEPSVHKEALQQILMDERKPVGLRTLVAERWGIYDQLERAKGSVTPDGQQVPPTAPPPMQVLGTPPDIAAQFMTQPMMQGAAPPAGGGQPPGPPGGDALLTSPTPGLTSLPTQASQQQLLPLGQFGAVEEASQEQNQF
jgi:hypothetical protein